MEKELFTVKYQVTTAAKRALLRKEELGMQ